MTKEIRALLVDDDLSFQQLTQYQLMDQGVEVVVASSTTQADAILKTTPVDVIICDVLMVMEDGISYCRRLRHAGNTTPVIFLSSLSDPKTIRLGYESGGTVFIAKPFNSEDLRALILEVVKSISTFKAPSK
jgi:two-component system phosphate regulon response regulator OmpR